MNQAWQQYMSDQQMHLSPEGIAQYQPPQKHLDLSKPALLSVDCLSVLSLRGEKAITALQGQITQDARKLSEGKTLFTDICNPKGRIIASALLVPGQNDEIYVLVDSLQAQLVCEHLNKYLMFHRVKLEPSEQLVLLAELHSETATGEHPTALISPQLKLHLLSSDVATDIWARDLRPKGGAQAWNTLLILHGICWVGANLTETYTPHHLNHPGVNFVSFKKGCYTGQEIIARMKYKAQLKTHFRLLEAGIRAVGETLTDAQGAPAGKVITAYALSEYQWIYCAEIKVDALENTESLFLDQEILRPFNPPYAINN